MPAMQMKEALEYVAANDSIRVLILESAVDRVFCAGADLKERATMTPEEAMSFVSVLRSSFMQLGMCRVPVIAAIEGAALGGGLELAMACDLRVASSSCSLGLPETGLAIIPGAGGTQRLPRLVGAPRAKELIFTGRRVGSEEAKAIGLVEFAVGAGEAGTKAREVAAAMVDKGPIALQAAKLAIDGGAGLSLRESMAVEAGEYDKVLASKDRLEGLAAFREKRKPVYFWGLAY
jgi:methylglutaconyl-CoA hydratase